MQAQAEKKGPRNMRGPNHPILTAKCPQEDPAAAAWKRLIVITIMAAVVAVMPVTVVGNHVRIALVRTVGVEFYLHAAAANI